MNFDEPLSAVRGHTERDGSLHGLQLDMQSVTAGYPGVVVYEDLDITIPAGSLIGLMGENGAGKSTFLKLAAQLHSPASGHVRWTDNDGATRKGIRHVGFVSQQCALYPDVTAQSFLTYIAKLKGIKACAVPAMIDEVVDTFDLGSVFDRKCGTLSGGQARRVHVASAFLGRPRALILDEPTNAIDEATRDRIIKAVHHINDRGCTILYSTHVREELRALKASLLTLTKGGSFTFDRQLTDWWDHE